jgi:hypothetical protein
LAAGLGWAIPASAEAKLRFRPCDEARCAGRRVRARMLIPSRFAEAFEEVEEGGASAHAAAFGGLVR